jgi:hypothetical protein
MDFILLAVPINDLPKAYRNYLSMMSGNICRLMRHNFNRQEILYDLHPKIMEQISMHEGVFPESEMAPTIHQVIHIASYILKMGAPKEWWNLPCERAIGQIKQFVPKGGTSIEITVFNKYLRFEMSSMFENYSLSKMGHDDDSCAFIAPTTDDGSRKPLFSVYRSDGQIKAYFEKNNMWFIIKLEYNTIRISPTVGWIVK